MNLKDRPDGASATGQRGITSRRFTPGVVSDDMLRSRAQSGSRITSEQFEALRLLMLDVGEPVWAFGPTGAALQGYEGYYLRPPFHLLHERHRHITRIGHVIHSTLTLDPIDREEIFGLGVTAPARTAIDLVRYDTPARCKIGVASALRDGLLTETHLHSRIAALRTKGRHGIPALLRIMEELDLSRADSWLERRLLEIVAAAGLPTPHCQVVLTKAKDKIVRVDFRFPGTSLVVEVLGYRFHRTRDQLQRDAERANELTLAGYVVLQFTYLHVTEQPDWVVAQITAGLRRSAELRAQADHRTPIPPLTQTLSARNNVEV